MKKEFIVLSRQQVEIYEYEEPHVNISIHDSMQPVAELSLLATGRKAELFLEFHDCDDITLNGCDIFTGINNNKIQCITKFQAQQIVNFYNEWKDKVNLFVINCEAGISRSSATAAALSVIAGQGDEFIFNSRRYQPNMLVYRTILNEGM